MPAFERRRRPASAAEAARLGERYGHFAAAAPAAAGAAGAAAAGAAPRRRARPSTAGGSAAARRCRNNELAARPASARPGLRRGGGGGGGGGGDDASAFSVAKRLASRAGLRLVARTHEPGALYADHEDRENRPPAAAGGAQASGSKPLALASPYAQPQPRARAQPREHRPQSARLRYGAPRLRGGAERRPLSASARAHGGGATSGAFLRSGPHRAWGGTPRDELGAGRKAEGVGAQVEHDCVGGVPARQRSLAGGGGSSGPQQLHQQAHQQQHVQTGEALRRELEALGVPRAAVQRLERAMHVHSAGFHQLVGEILAGAGLTPAELGAPAAGRGGAGASASATAAAFSARARTRVLPSIWAAFLSLWRDELEGDFGGDLLAMRADVRRLNEERDSLAQRVAELEQVNSGLVGTSLERMLQEREDGAALAGMRAELHRISLRAVDAEGVRDDNAARAAELEAQLKVRTDEHEELRAAATEAIAECARASGSEREALHELQTLQAAHGELRQLHEDAMTQIDKGSTREGELARFVANVSEREETQVHRIKEISFSKAVLQGRIESLKEEVLARDDAYVARDDAKGKADECREDMAAAQRDARETRADNERLQRLLDEAKADAEAARDDKLLADEALANFTERYEGAIADAATERTAMAAERMAAEERMADWQRELDATLAAARGDNNAAVEAATRRGEEALAAALQRWEDEARRLRQELGVALEAAADAKAEAGRSDANASEEAAKAAAEMSIARTLAEERQRDVERANSRAAKLSAELDAARKAAGASAAALCAKEADVAAGLEREDALRRAREGLQGDLESIKAEVVSEREARSAEVESSRLANEQAQRSKHEEEAAKKTAATAAARVQSLTDALAEGNNKISSLTTKWLTLGTQNEELTKSVEQLRAEGAELSMENTRLFGELTALKGTCETQGVEIKELHEQSDAFEQRAKSLDAELSETSRKAESTITDLGARLEARELELADLRKQVARAGKETDDMESQRQRLSNFAARRAGAKFLEGLRRRRDRTQLATIEEPEPTPAVGQAAYIPGDVSEATDDADEPLPPPPMLLRTQSSVEQGLVQAAVAELSELGAISVFSPAPDSDIGEPELSEEGKALADALRPLLQSSARAAASTARSQTEGLIEGANARVVGIVRAVLEIQERIGDSVASDAANAAGGALSQALERYWSPGGAGGTLVGAMGQRLDESEAALRRATENAMRLDATWRESSKRLQDRCRKELEDAQAQKKRAEQITIANKWKMAGLEQSRKQLASLKATLAQHKERAEEDRVTMDVTATLRAKLDADRLALDEATARNGVLSDKLSKRESEVSALRMTLRMVRAKAAEQVRLALGSVVADGARAQGKAVSASQAVAGVAGEVTRLVAKAYADARADVLKVQAAYQGKLADALEETCRARKAEQVANAEAREAKTRADMLTMP